MAGFNRYDDISTSTYTPRSLQETLMVPMMKRQQHDASAAQLEAQIGELGKVDPLSQHFEEAQKIKADLTKKIDEQAQGLASKGFDFNTTGDILKTNRMLKEQFAPTGRLGQINAAKTQYFKEKEDFLKNAEAQKIGRDQALKRWNEKTAGYTGYDQARGITNVSPQGLAAHQDYEDDLSKYHSILGETEETAKHAGYRLADSGLGDGSMVMVNESGKKVTSSNLDQLNNALRGFSAKWINPSGEGARYAADAGLNITPQKVASDFAAMMKTKSGYEQDQSANFIKADDTKKPLQPTDLEGVNVEAVGTEINKNLSDALEGNLEKGTNMIKALDLMAGEPGHHADYKDRERIKQATIQTPEYQKVANGIARANPAFAKMRYDDPKMVEKVKSYLKENKDLTYQNKYNDPNVDKTALMFADRNLPKEKKAASQHLLDKVMGGGATMKTIDGKDVDLNKIKGFTYLGDMTPKSQVNVFSEPKQNILPHRGYIKVDDGDGDSHIEKVYISRSQDDFNKPQHRAATFVNSISKIADTQPGIYHKVDSDLFRGHGLSNVELKYNKGSKTYNMSYTTPSGATRDEKLTEAELYDMALHNYSKLK